MKTEIIIKGVGGQGIQKLTEIIGKAALKEKKCFIAALDYDAVVRGGISNSRIIIADECIINPVVENIDKPDILINLRTKNIIMYNQEVTPKTENIDESLRKNDKLLGMWLVGVVMGYTGLVQQVSVRESIEKCLSSKYQQLNLKAMEAGWLYGVKLKKGEN